MARISEEVIQKIKQEIDLVALVRSKGIELKPHGDNLIGLCPFHNDTNPSLVVTPKKNLWHCLGACQTGGSVIDWVMKAEGVSFRHAVEILRENKATLLMSAEMVKKSTVNKLPPPISSTADDQTLLHQVINYYQEQLKKNEQAIEYLKVRKIYSEEILEVFKIGFADRTLGLRIPFSNREEGKELRERLQKLGIIRETGHEHFNGSAVFPIFDKDNITEVYGRKVTNGLRKGTPMHTYLPGPHGGIFNYSHLAANNPREIILCESIIDALSFYNHSFKNVTCSYGINGFTEEHLSFLIKNKIDKVYIAYDNDDAGSSASEKLAAKLTKEGIACYRITFPRDMDANSFVVNASEPTIELQRIINAAEPIGEKIQASSFLACTPAEAKKEEVNSLAAKEKINIPTKVTETGIHIQRGDREYRIRGFERNLSYDIMKVNLMVSCNNQYHVDNIDIYNARVRQQFIKQASEELDVKPETIKGDIGRILLKLEELQAEQIKKALEPRETKVEVPPEEKEKAIIYAKHRELLKNILKDFNKMGVVGEEDNKLLGLLAGVSRKLDEPLAIIIQSSSAAGKTSLMDAILNFMPDEEVIRYSAMTGQSLFYMGNTNLKYKILAIAEEEGARQVSYSLKILHSDKKLRIASTGKDPQTGKLITHEYEVEGPVMIFMTTTAIDIDEELMNRCVVLSVDENREQTRAIHQIQRELQTIEGLIAKEEKQEIIKLHQNLQRLLKPIRVAIPQARNLTFKDTSTRMRRDHMKYLTIIKAVTLLHQYQRPKKYKEYKGRQIEYIEATLDDIEEANKLSNVGLGHSVDEMPPKTRELLRQIYIMAAKYCNQNKIEQKDCLITKRDIREYTGWSDTALRKHLQRLEELEYVVVHKKGQRHFYELLYHGEEGKFMVGLIDVEKLRAQEAKRYNYDDNRAPLNGEKAPRKHPQNTPVAPQKHPCENLVTPLAARA